MSTREIPASDQAGDDGALWMGAASSEQTFAGPIPALPTGLSKRDRKRAARSNGVGPGPVVAAPKPVTSTRKKTMVYDDQARRPSRKRAAPPPVEIRRVRRVLRRIDIWSLFRFAFLLYLCALVVFLASAVGLWLVASSAGAIPSIESFITQLFALKRFRFQAHQLFLGTVGIGLVLMFVATLFTVIAGVLYNLISDVVGGIELTVLEEEPIEIIG